MDANIETLDGLRKNPLAPDTNNCVALKLQFWLLVQFYHKKRGTVPYFKIVHDKNELEIPFLGFHNNKGKSADDSYEIVCACENISCYLSFYRR